MLAILELSTGYQILGLLHILSVVAAFGPPLLYPSLQRAGASATVAKLHLRLTLPALVLAWVFGIGLVGMSDDAISMSDPWVSASMVLWLGLVATSVLLIKPALEDTSTAARAKLAAGMGVTHMVMVVILYLMIFKPGA